MAIAGHGLGGLDYVAIGGGECAAAVPLQDQLCLAGAWRGPRRLNVHFAQRAPMMFRDSDSCLQEEHQRSASCE